jgi:hypothetical protein
MFQTKVAEKIKTHILKKIRQSRYRLGVAQRVPGSTRSQIS